MSIPLPMKPEYRSPKTFLLVSSSRLNGRPLLIQHWLVRLFRAPVPATVIKAHAVQSRSMNDMNMTVAMTSEFAAQTLNGHSTLI